MKKKKNHDWWTQVVLTVKTNGHWRKWDSKQVTAECLKVVSTPAGFISRIFQFYILRGHNPNRNVLRECTKTGQTHTDTSEPERSVLIVRTTQNVLSMIRNWKRSPRPVLPHNTGRWCVCSRMKSSWHTGQHLGRSRGHTHRPLSRARCRREVFQNRSPDRHLHRAHSGCSGDSSELEGGWEAEVSDNIGKVVYSVLWPGPVFIKLLKVSQWI